MPALDFDEMAERIVRTEGVAFARAWNSAASDLARKDEFLLAREALKKAIVDAFEKSAKIDRKFDNAKTKRQGAPQARPRI
jgi:hypothetical protein